MAKLSGRVTIRVNGDALRTQEGASLDIGGAMREPVTNDQGTVDYVEKIKHAQVRCSVSHTRDFDLIALRDGTLDASISFEADNGAVWVVPNAFVTEIGEISSGRVDVTFAGNPAQRVA